MEPLRLGRGPAVELRGFIEVADGGTLFIDELATGLQAKLLRVLEDGTMRRVGSTRERTVDARVIAATNRHLRKDVDEGRFRDDLYYRLNVLTIEMPPLRARRADIPLLIEYFLRRRGSQWQIDDDARKVLSNYHWPGNVRELANVLERATILAENRTICLNDLPTTMADASGNAATNHLAAEPDNLAERERLHVERVLNRVGYNRNRAAKTLGINRRSLYRLIDKYEIEVPSRGGDADEDA